MFARLTRIVVIRTLPAGKALNRQQLSPTLIISTTFSAHRAQEGPGRREWCSGLSVDYTRGSKDVLFEGGRSGPGAPDPQDILSSLRPVFVRIL